ncbi:hypothetical protein SCJ60_06270 [Legionella pneumophila serogroup 9]
MKLLDQHVSQALDDYGIKLEQHFECSVLAYLGAIHPAFIPPFMEYIERISKNKSEHPAQERLVVILTTGGGVVEAVEKMVEIMRYHFNEIFFVIPASAMSAGTIWSMSGDKIYMDYSSSLGPIDPQVPNLEGKLVPALGYIDKVDEFIGKSKVNNLSPAEYMFLKSLDLASLRRYEQARDLSISLLKQWLVKYKFKDWTVHRTNKPGTLVTQEEKEVRAEQIAKMLSDNKLWHSHGRMIGIDTIKNELRLEVEDFSKDENLRYNLRAYNGLLTEYIEKEKQPYMLHSPRI